MGRGSRPARIFESKLGKDFKQVTVVSAGAKGVCWSIIVSINIFFIYYVLIHSYLRGRYDL